MRHLMLVIVGAALVVTSARAQTQLGAATDEAAISKNLDARNAAYNKHDAKALAALYAADADRVTNAGVFSGRAQIEKSYADNFNGVGKDAVLKSDSRKVRFLTADVATLEAVSTISGRTDGTIKTHTTGTYVKRNGAWMLVEARTVRMDQ